MTESTTPVATTTASATVVAESAVAYPEPPRRALQIYAIDPMVARLAGNETVTITVPYEPLAHGPSGELVRVIDYDGSTGRYYAPVDLDDPRLLLQNGLPPSERDPRFHQQMTYAVISALLENFEQGLGRRFRWQGNKRLRVFPHAFRGENAQFDPDMDGCLKFGYFRADEKAPGRNLPGQFVFTCLSHDIVVHEATHALVHRLRREYKDPSNLDVYAFHEGFSDAVALFQHFSLPELVARYIQQTRTDLTSRTPLVELAQQFGEGSGRGRALRDALGDEPNPTRLANTYEPHARGGIFVAAIFDGFFSAYQTSIADLLRIATSGTGLLPEGALHPDLVNRVSTEARKTAHRFLMMSIRAFQYLPPVDVTFGDFLRSAVTADRDLYPNDTAGLRTSLVEGFRKRGIYPSDVGALADDAIAWPDAADRGLPPLPRSVIDPLVMETAIGFRARRGEPEAAEGIDRRRRSAIDGVLTEYGRVNAERLGLLRDVPIELQGFHSTFRVGANGLLNVDVIVRYLQAAPDDVRAKTQDALGGVLLKGGATVVADATGRVRHVVTRPTPVLGGHGAIADHGVTRMRAIAHFVDTFDAIDMMGPWRPDDPEAAWNSMTGRRDRSQRIARTLSLGRIDGSPW